MIKGNINPPKFSIENEKIAIRHVYASAFSFSGKDTPNIFQQHLQWQKLMKMVQVDLST